jgi:hypothetical protein
MTPTLLNTPASTSDTGLHALGSPCQAFARPSRYAAPQHLCFYFVVGPVHFRGFKPWFGDWCVFALASKWCLEEQFFVILIKPEFFLIIIAKSRGSPLIIDLNDPNSLQLPVNFPYKL